MTAKNCLFFILCSFALNNANNNTLTHDITTTIKPNSSNNFSRIATIIYISLYVLILFIIGIIIKIKSGIKICSKKYFRAVWIQKGIYSGMLIHIYDTATDVGVLIDWYFLMKNEMNGFNYENIDMKVFFWCSIASIILYRIWSAYMSWVLNQFNSNIPFYRISLVILSLFELSIFVYVYESFKTSQKKVNEYYGFEKKRKKLKLEMKHKLKKEMELQINASKNDTKTEMQESIEVLEHKMQEIIEEIKPDVNQTAARLIEGIFESMPQILLQSIFLLRSYNTPLSEDSNSVLIVTSLIASVLSISTKIISWDVNDLRGESESKAKSDGCKVKLICIDNECSFKGCNHWYFIRVFWRIFNILNRFIILSLIWTVLGGIIFGIYIGTSILYNIIVMWYIDNDFCIAFGVGIISILMIPGLVYNWILFIIIKCIDNLIIITLILLFTLINIECNICSDIDWSINNLLLAFIISSCITYAFDTLFAIIILKFKPNLFKSD